MAVSWDALNLQALSAFSINAIHTNLLGTETAIQGVLDTGVQPEDAAPGDSSTYAKFWTPSSTFSSGPEPRETITIGSSVYTIVRKEIDAGGGLWILLRHKRDL
jgi:hypothetical protein